MATTKQQLIKEIKELEEAQNSDLIPAEIKEDLRKEIAASKKQLAELEEAEKKANSRKPEVKKEGEQKKKKALDKVKERIKKAKDTKKVVAKKEKEVKEEKPKRTPKKSAPKTKRKPRVTGRSERDASRKALKPGWKKSKETGKWYYEDRANRTDRQRKSYPYLEDGGTTDFTNDGAGMFAGGGKIKDKVETLYKKADKLWQDFVGNGGRLNYSEKNYGYLSDELTEVEVGYLGIRNDSTYADELRSDKFKLTGKEAYDILDNRINSINEEISETYFETGGTTDFTNSGAGMFAGGGVFDDNKDLSRDRMFKSKEKWEQKYKRKGSPKNPRYNTKKKISKYAGGGVTDTPKIYVADLSAYNDGKLVGEWVDLSEFDSGAEVMDKISELLKGWSESSGELREEYAIHDYENFSRSLYSEYMGEDDFDKVIKIYKIAEEKDIPADVIGTVISEYDPSDISDFIDERFEGQFDSDTDLAYHYVEMLGGIEQLGKDTTERYFDYEAFGRDLAFDYNNYDGYYFRSYKRGGQLKSYNMKKYMSGGATDFVNNGAGMFANGGHTGKKTYDIMYNIGRAEYVVNYHDGIKKHKDGSPFSDIAIFRNKKDLSDFVNKLESEGYKKIYASGGATGEPHKLDASGDMFADGGAIVDYSYGLLSDPRFDVHSSVFKKGGKVSNKYNYLSKWNIATITTDDGAVIDGNDIIDGIYVKKKVKF